MPEHPLNADCGDAKVSCSDCDADGPVIGLDMDVHTLADWPGLEAEAIAAWNRRPAPETGFLGHLVVPKSGVGAVFIGKGEPVPLMGDKGRVVPVYDGPQNVTANDPMEAVAWREKVIGLIDRYLHGIEHEETTNPDGWWETSRGAAFGAKVKADLKDAILALIATHPEPGA
tara:strand:+ start:964 stop:1479 length:516 start_codon:yes stop_codon:yes gene_type:complete